MSDIHNRSEPRSIYEATMDAKFGIHYNDMNARLYRRLDFLFGFIGLFGGSSALVAAIGNYQALGIASGAAIAACAVIERLVASTEKALRHDDYKRRFGALVARCSQLTLEQIDQELITLQTEAPSGFHALKVPAYNALVKANSQVKYLLPQSTWENIMERIA